MTTVPDRSTFEGADTGQAAWAIGKPQKPFIDMADRITGSVLSQVSTGEDSHAVVRQEVGRGTVGLPRCPATR